MINARALPDQQGKLEPKPFDLSTVTLGSAELNRAIARVPRVYAFEAGVVPLRLEDDGLDDVLVVAAGDANRYATAQAAILKRSEDRRAGKSALHATDRQSGTEKIVMDLRVSAQVDRIEFVQATDPTEISRLLPKLYGAESTGNADAFMAEIDRLMADSIYKRFTDWQTKVWRKGGVLEGMVDQRWVELRRFENDTDYHRFVFAIKQRAEGSSFKANQSVAPQDGAFSIALPHRHVDARINVMPVETRVRGDAVVSLESLWLRFHDYDLDVATTDRLGMQTDLVDVLCEAFVVADPLKVTHDALYQPRGMVWFVGPPGVGKTTTMVAIAYHHIMPRGLQVFTVENPRERRAYGLTQFEVNEHGMTFEAIARAHKRRRYHLSMIGEGRDHESLMAGFEAVGSGGLGAQTVHSDDSIAVFPKAIHQFSIPVALLEEYIKLNVAQRLVLRLCGDCKRPIEAPEKLVAFRPSAAGATIYEPVGCEMCFGTGYRREIAVFEYYIPSTRFWEALRAGSTLAQLYQVAFSDGYRPMFEHGLDRVLAGETSVTELFSKVPKPIR